jgi:methylmalonyl-CoA mutase N-terminal domain/subunit
MAAGEVGRVGVAIDSIDDMATLLDGTRSIASRRR